MEFRHLGTTPLETHRMLQVGGRHVQQRHDELLRIVQQLGLREQLLFAEPIVTWPSGEAQGHVAWYADVRGGAPALISLTGQAYDRAAFLLREALTKLFAVNLQADEVALLHAACVLAAPDGVLIDGERLVLFGWGLVSGRSGRVPSGVPPLEATPLAPFLPSTSDIPEIALPGSKEASPPALSPAVPGPTPRGSASSEVPGDVPPGAGLLEPGLHQRMCLRRGLGARHRAESAEAARGQQGFRAAATPLDGRAVTRLDHPLPPPSWELQASRLNPGRHEPRRLPLVQTGRSTHRRSTTAAVLNRPVAGSLYDVSHCDDPVGCRVGTLHKGFAGC